MQHEPLRSLLKLCCLFVIFMQSNDVQLIEDVKLHTMTLEVNEMASLLKPTNRWQRFICTATENRKKKIPQKLRIL